MVLKISQDMWRDPKTIPKKPKFLADANIPLEIVNEIKSSKISIISVHEMGVGNLEDEEILKLAKRKNKILLTMDKDFWNEQKFPINKFGGLIFLDINPSNINKALNAFYYIWFTLLKYFHVSNIRYIKARVTESNYFLSIIAYTGERTCYEFKIEHRQLLARELKIK